MIIVPQLRSKLLKTLNNRFNNEEIDEIVFSLGFKSDNYPHTLNKKIVKLLQDCEKDEILEDLFELLSEERPKLDWYKYFQEDPVRQAQDQPENELVTESFTPFPNQISSGVIQATQSSQSRRSKRITRNEEKPFALVMKGGGVKGLAYIGALRELEKHFKFNWFIGTSAGAIAAVLLGAGYTIDEVEEVLSGKDFRDFLDASFFGAAFNLIAYKGLYEANAFTEWIDSLLAKKLQKGFQIKMKHMPKRITVYASRRTEDTLVFDSSNAKWEDMPVSYAVRCSMSIPIIFTPQRQYGMRVFDGGMRNNYPVKALLKDNPDLDFIGLYLGPEIYEHNANPSQVHELLSIWTETSDINALEEYEGQTIIIDPRPIRTVDFKLVSNEKKFLIEVGNAAALNFLLQNQLLDDSGKVRLAKEKVKSLRTHIIKKRKRRRLLRLFLLLILIIVAYLIWIVLPGANVDSTTTPTPVYTSSTLTTLPPTTDTSSMTPPHVISPTVDVSLTLPTTAPSPTSQTATPSITPTIVYSGTSTSMPTATLTSTSTATVVPQPSPNPCQTRSPIQTPTPNPSATAGPSPTATNPVPPYCTSTPTSTSSPTSTNTPTNIPTNEPPTVPATIPPICLPGRTC